jgi:hypothetical protein
MNDLKKRSASLEKRPCIKNVTGFRLYTVTGFSFATLLERSNCTFLIYLAVCMNDLRKDLHTGFQIFDIYLSLSHSLSLYCIIHYLINNNNKKTSKAK